MEKVLAILLAFGMLVLSSAPVHAGPGKGYSSSSSSGVSKSYSKPNSVTTKPPSSSSTSKPPSSTSKPPSNDSPGKGYSSSNSAKPVVIGGNSTGNKAPPGYSTNNSSYSKKPTETFQSLPAAEQKKSEARAAYQKATAPKESYTTKTGETKKIDTADPKTKQVQDTYAQNPDKWVTRKDRIDSTYGSYYSRPTTTTIVYHDRVDYNPYFWMWLADRSFDDRANWYYHHRSDVDDKRYADVMAKDAQLEARVRELEAKKVNRDPGHVPPGMEADEQYDEEFVDGVFNPEPRTSTLISWGGFFHGLWVVVKWIVGIILLAAMVYGAYWLIFQYRW